MTDSKMNETTRELIDSLRETSKTIADSAIAAQEHNVAFAQNILENGVEVLKSHAESTRSLMQELSEQARKQPNWQEGFQAVVDSTVAAQERNTRFAQSVFENGIEVLKSQVGLTRGLMQELEQQAHKQQDAFQALARESWDTYLGFMRAPFSYYQRAFDTAQTTMREGVEDFKKAADQGVENLQKETRSTEKATQKASR
ncbi:MAG: hypothetical protein E6I32_17840 [Chloroflexi bacterium]|nr:MAG: hypothetical protein E6I32_17840 [Chloroflexota bacterium]